MVPSSDHPLGGDPAPWFLVWASARTETVASAGGGTGRFAMGFLERKKESNQPAFSGSSAAVGRLQPAESVWSAVGEVSASTVV